MAPSVREVQFEMDKMRELLRRVLGVSSISADLSEVVSLLLKGLRELEQKCPKLMCHLHVSGVSEADGQSFFVVLHDSALDQNKAARRVVNSVYTHLHSEASMAMTSALWLASRPGRPPTASGAAAAGGSPLDPPSQTPQTPSDGAAPGTAPGADGDAGCSDEERLNGDVAEADPVVSSLPPAAAPPDGAETEGGNGGDNDEGYKAVLPAATAPPPAADPMLELSAGFRAPEVHVPSAVARKKVEYLFVGRKTGWSALIRETLVEMRTVLRGHHGVTHPPRLMGMLKWWPVDLDAKTDADEEETTGGVNGTRRGNLPQCRHFPFPVLVERRHLPIRERLRKKDDFETEVVEVTNIVPPRSEFLYGVVSTILLLLDKEPCVRPVVAKKLATCGIVLDEDGKENDAATPPAGDDSLDDFVNPPNDPLVTPPTVDDPDPNPDGNDGAGADDEGAVAARLAARQRAAAASLKAREVLAERKAMATAKPTRKRKSTAGAPGKTKRARMATALDDQMATELFLPPLTANEDVESCTVLVEANMVSEMTYLTMATNWCVPAVATYVPNVTADVADAQGWPGIVEGQATIDFLLAEADVVKARQIISRKADELRTDGHVDADETATVYIKATPTDELPVRTLTLQTLEAMSTIHRAGLRLQALRVAVAWLEEASKHGNARVPSFWDGETNSVGAAGTIVMERLLACSPNSAVWRIGGRGSGGLDEDVVISAHQVIGNMADTDMVDDVITVNSIILQRVCTKKGINAHILQCSLFNRLLQASNEVDVSAIAEEVHQRAGGATTFAGVCNISNTHWVAFVVELTTKTITKYDSGAHFVSLATAVSAAVDRVREFSKSLGELQEAAPNDDPVEGHDALEGAPALAKKLKVWSVRRVSAPAQEDTCSCGPFAFAYVWHATQGKKSKLKSADAAAVRMEMLAAVVTDGLDAGEAG